MQITVRAYQPSDLPDMIRIWNEVVEDGIAFPQEHFLDEQTGAATSADAPPPPGAGSFEARTVTNSRQDLVVISIKYSPNLE